MSSAANSAAPSTCSHLSSTCSPPSTASLPRSPLFYTYRLRRSSAPITPFTHLLHSRYPSPTALADYSAHPNHVEVVRGAILPICDDIMALDWVSADPDSGESPTIGPRKAVKVTLLKLREGLGEEEGKGVVLDAITGMKGKVKGGLEAVSFGGNFSPARAKGFGIALEWSALSERK